MTSKTFRDPVLATDGYTYEREAITQWISEEGISPFTGQPLRINDLRFDDRLQLLAEQYRNEQPPENSEPILIRRLSPRITEKIELEHSGKLGIGIVGGLGSEHIAKDHGIFIKRIDKHQTNNQLDIGDRLLAISSTHNIYDLRFVTQDIARKRIQLACAESQKITLHVGHTKPIIRVHRGRCGVEQGQCVCYDLNDESSVDLCVVHFVYTELIFLCISFLSTRRCSNYQRSDNRDNFSNNYLSYGRGTNRPPLWPVVERKEPKSYVIKKLFNDLSLGLQQHPW
ncbi:unnamed protein product [Rotaria sordida]|uniref:U-box domain-containing protein n=1 Tax=Rotaria sordida TaxID=392033 RepID=A0A818X1Y9_9BILA|nr:unnamed protein product [Rotaria sordida]